MIQIQHLVQHLMAIFAFVLLPTAFWGSMFYYFTNPTLGMISVITMLISGAYTCIKGKVKDHKWIPQ